ncbi:hypothetical protein D915_008621 [Fasciola hepatica]|uniref:Uncharacterized protein n=1 Tax=Fasciola hepatica TaxID=6192 RepID=A0A4E0QY87_FASHE|nr:hypothetical protein D915_008621 [Fasciola hepatica]
MEVLARTIVRNLKLLEFDFTAHDLPSDPESFRPGGRLTGSDMVLKNTFHKWLKSLGSHLQLPVTLFRVWGTPAGLALLQFFESLSIFALQSAYDIAAEPQYHSMDTFQSNLEKLEENAKILRCYVRNLARFRDGLIERRKIAESRLSSTMVDVRHFVESQSQT